jgi:hypothetical protein
MNNTPQIEIKYLTNIVELCKACQRYERNTLTLEEIYQRIFDWYVLGYEVYVDGSLRGWSYALCVDGVFTLDGHNEGVPIFYASKAGKLVCADLFERHTKTIFTVHDEDERHLHTLVRRIGFKTVGTKEGKTFFRLDKE